MSNGLRNYIVGVLVGIYAGSLMTFHLMKTYWRESVPAAVQTFALPETISAEEE